MDRSLSAGDEAGLFFLKINGFSQAFFGRPVLRPSVFAHSLAGGEGSIAVSSNMLWKVSGDLAAD